MKLLPAPLLFVILLALCSREWVKLINGKEVEGEDDASATAESGVVMFDVQRMKRTVSNTRRSRRYLAADEESPHAPVYRGIGTHFIYVHVGTPRQRVSVIIDTGSHHTAFPCTGCSQCGDHTDVYFNPMKSSTVSISKCGSKKCLFSQSYTEGSMWTAYRVRDKFYIGGEVDSMVPNARKFDVDFTFGCQMKETGMFRTQIENGIMGLSGDAKTLPNTLYKANITSTNAFSLCFLPSGGVMSLGGTHPKLKQGKMVHAQLLKKSGYFTVRVLSILMRNPSSSDLVEMKYPLTKLNSGKGLIVDSGTTDTYLPSALSSTFQSLFKRLSGVSYTRSSFLLTAEEIKKLPTIVFRLQKWDPSTRSKEYVQLEMPPTRYLESSKRGGQTRYVFRLYLTERSGGVLGANFMIGHNIEFDQKNQRLGVAVSHCKTDAGDPLYEGITSPTKLKKHLRKLEDMSVNISTPRRRLSEEIYHSDSRLRATGPCSAQCPHLKDSSSAEASSSVIRVSGFMPASDDQLIATHKEGHYPAIGKVPCSILCEAKSGTQLHEKKISSSPAEKCVVAPWGLCQDNCSQSRDSGRIAELLSDSSNCKQQQLATRKCRSQLCPFNPSTECVHHVRLTFPHFKLRKWNDLWKEDVIEALSLALKVDAGRMDIPGPLKTEETKIVAIVHVRMEKLKLTGSDACPIVETMTNSSLASDKFIKSLHDLSSTVSGSWEWVTRSNAFLEFETHVNWHDSQLELRIRPKLLRRQAKKDFNTAIHQSKVSGGKHYSSESAPSRWWRLFVEKDNFVVALCYCFSLFAAAVFLHCYYRPEYAAVRKALEAPRGDINGYRYHSQHSGQ